MYRCVVPGSAVAFDPGIHPVVSFTQYITYTHTVSVHYRLVLRTNKECTSLLSLLEFHLRVVGRRHLVRIYCCCTCPERVVKDTRFVVYIAYIASRDHARKLRKKGGKHQEQLQDILPSSPKSQLYLQCREQSVALAVFPNAPLGAPMPC